MTVYIASYIYIIMLLHADIRLSVLSAYVPRNAVQQAQVADLKCFGSSTVAHACALKTKLREITVSVTLIASTARWARSRSPKYTLYNHVSSTPLHTSLQACQLYTCLFYNPCNFPYYIQCGAYGSMFM